MQEWLQRNKEAYAELDDNLSQNLIEQRNKNRTPKTKNEKIYQQTPDQPPHGGN